MLHRIASHADQTRLTCEYVEQLLNHMQLWESCGLPAKHIWVATFQPDDSSTRFSKLQQ